MSRYSTNGERKPPLHEAARLGHEKLVKQFLKNGSDVNAQDNTKFTALHGAALNGYRNMVELLIENGADIYAKDEEGWSPLYVRHLQEREQLQKS